MTFDPNKDEREIETLRYRAPGVVPLSDGRVAILTSGRLSQWTVCTTLEQAHEALSAYIEWNVLGSRAERPRLDPTDEEIERAWALIGGQAPSRPSTIS